MISLLLILVRDHAERPLNLPVPGSNEYLDLGSVRGDCKFTRRVKHTRGIPAGAMDGSLRRQQ